MTTEKGKKLTTYIASTKGVINPADVQAEVSKMAAQCPQATAEEKGLVTDVEKAYEVMLITTGAQVPTATTAVTTAPTAEMSAAAAQQIGRTLAAQQSERSAVTANTRCSKLVIDRPDPKEVITAGTKGEIKATSWNKLKEKIASGEYEVLPDDDDSVEESKRIKSQTNFKALDAAFASKSQVDVYIGNMNMKAIGVIMSKGSKTATGSVAEQQTLEHAKDFITLEGAGYVMASEKEPGLRLRYMKPKDSKTEVGKRIPGRTVLVITNKKATIESGNYVVSREVTPEVTAQSAKSALQFRVRHNNETLADGITKKVVTMRASLTASLPVLARKAEFTKEFGTGVRESNGDLINPPTEQQVQKINEAQLQAIQELRSKAASATDWSEMTRLEEKLKAFEGPQTAAPAAAI